MCQDNTSQLLCGIPTKKYHTATQPMLIHFDGSHHGFILWAFAVADTPIQDTIARLDSSMPVPDGADDFISYLWQGCDMDGPEREGLLSFHPEFVKMVMRLAKASIQLGVRDLPATVHQDWERDFRLAYKWLKQRKKEGYDIRNTMLDQDDEKFSDYATVVEHMSSDQQQRLWLRLGTMRGEPSEGLCRLLARNDAKKRYDELFEEHEELVRFYENCVDNKEKMGYEERLEVIGLEMDKLRCRYLENGGKASDQESNQDSVLVH